MSKKIVFIGLLLFTLGISAQQKISKRIKSDANYVEIRTNGIDNLIIQETDSDELEMTITDQDGLGVLDDFSCTEGRCVVQIKTELKIEHPNTNKINQFPVQPPSNVSAVVKIPKKRKVTVFGDEIDIQTKGYQGTLLILIEKGSIKIDQVKGITDIELNSGSVYANVNKNQLDIKTRKGSILLNDSVQKSPLRRKRKNSHRFVVKSVNANVVLTEQ